MAFPSGASKANNLSHYLIHQAYGVMRWSRTSSSKPKKQMTIQTTIQLPPSMTTLPPFILINHLKNKKEFLFLFSL